MNLKEQYRRFRTWQKETPHFSDKNLEEHQCANCGHQYTGKYCPICGQPKGDKRITWNWVRDNVMILWGMDSHSMPYSLLQLLLRPGYFISDYLNGHRQISYPPVKMLFILAIFYAIIEQTLGFDITHESPTTPELGILEKGIDWLSDNPGWSMLSGTMILLLPTWMFFRFSPRHSRHTLPEGFFIQIFMANILLICSLLSDIASLLILTVPFYYYITYRQLFGYHFWGTFWRLSASFIIWASTVIGIFIVAVMSATDDIEMVKSYRIGIIILIIIIIFTLVLGYYVGKWTEKRRIKKANNQA